MRAFQHSNIGRGRGERMRGRREGKRKEVIIELVEKGRLPKSLTPFSQQVSIVPSYRTIVLCLYEQEMFSFEYKIVSLVVTT